MKGGVKEYWSKRVLRYHHDRRNDLNTRTLQSLLEKNIDFYKPAEVLEIGCGPGIFTQILSKKTRVISLDISKDMLKFVKKRQIDAELLQADMDYLPFKPSSFDVIVAYRVMEYSKNPVKTLKVFSRLASTVLLQFPRHDSINGFLLLLYRNVLTFFGPSPSFRSYSLKEAVRLGKKAGFEIRSVIPYNKGYDMQVVMQTKR
jgi:ubiquinone/menaquinone biosynthesis C-methylase UbiE